eukprot:CAMPEP_0198703816 /NCGR_PEP_ID=MMETSP1468-20131203/389559_1 /TAXON_ID=1461545 /ORGANISM="Mantoniella sp, Strain CCMP1436" /LENGTH=183 /DNA_ID=CAMNT_0044462567 /DNA_START=415 /DNA_END=968 /DNA_ORIENTATION=+
MTHPATATHAKRVLESCIGGTSFQCSSLPTIKASHDDKDSPLSLTPPKTAKRPSLTPCSRIDQYSSKAAPSRSMSHLSLPARAALAPLPTTVIGKPSAKSSCTDDALVWQPCRCTLIARLEEVWLRCAYAGGQIYQVHRRYHTLILRVSPEWSTCPATLPLSFTMMVAAHDMLPHDKGGNAVN